MKKNVNVENGDVMFMLVVDDKWYDYIKKINPFISIENTGHIYMEIPEEFRKGIYSNGHYCMTRFIVDTNKRGLKKINKFMNDINSCDGPDVFLTPFAMAKVLVNEMLD